jgi:surface protein
MSSMFNNCESLTTIYGSNWDTSKSVHPWSNFSMFQGCNKLVGGKGTAYYMRNVDETYARIDQGKDAPGYFTDKNPTSIQPTTIGRQTDASVYDLQGRRVDSPSRRGVYIKDGRKIIR